ncbi:MAG: methylmalonyl-CoA mutase [Chloroflexi bacterium CG_4_9_14_3_um_filter_45_9]|nr:MAG: methylmalonyl-CoA mutase [Dehalococcoidia bacterium CG2_30_46_9]PIU23460.1 MAG: methylmalonyl-CoA mutase [Chloroflexi bacterium CG08_land_8_20_14_0_20_45_12]PIX27334.1 MAG: methylmalonyl-CoA mutase [Chloroflexi bacterium CG_4_8_14_3_um_filter_45_15]PJB49029.1 MAG: methylmalonyl-CoA mutase [Chloroflexi bacterium CG_4_9_14_3_um_filter_45_9]
MTSKTKQEWRENCLAPVVKRSPERQNKFETTSDIELDTVYTSEDLTGFDYLEDSGYPGEYPFTRGVQPNMYRGRIWTMRQYAGFGSAEETNQRYRYLLQEGQSGLSVAFDLPTQIGYDSDHPLARGEVGKVGVAVNSLQDMEIIFDGISLDRISTSMTINATCAPILAMYIAVAKKQGLALDKLDGTTQNDILKEYIARGTYIFPPKPSIRLIADTAAYCSKYLPRWNYINIAGYHIREAGATATQEIGFTLADAIEYVKAIVDTGLDVDSFAPRISFIFQTHNNFFEEIAKLRALRRLWAKIMKERFGAKNPRSWMFRTHIQTGGVTLTSQQPMNNIARATVQALAAVLGGIQSLAVSCYDEGHCIPTEESVRQSLRLQQILAYESGVTDVVDPLGGSYYIEWLTDELEKRGAEYIAKIDSLGGAAAAIEQGYQQKEIQESSYRYQKEIESGQRIVVGINKFISPSPKITLLRVGPEVEINQKNKLAKLKKNRDNTKVNQTLKRLENVAQNNDNTMPAFLECVEAYATLGEMCDVLRNVFSTQREFLVV